MADKLEAAFHGAPGGAERAEVQALQPGEMTSAVLLTFVDTDGSEWAAGATLTRLRPKGTQPGEDYLTLQMTQDNAERWRLKEFRVVVP